MMDRTARAQLACKCQPDVLATYKVDPLDAY
jgi:hypothetical protein